MDTSLIQRSEYLQAVDLFRAEVFNSSRSAFDLAVYNSKYVDFSTKIISIKNENAHCQLINLTCSNKEYLTMKNKIAKYEMLLCFLENIYSISPSYSRTD